MQTCHGRALCDQAGPSALGWTPSRRAPFAWASLLSLSILLACGTESERTPEADPRAGPVAPETGLRFPYVIEPACPGEGCTYGSWLACDSVPAYDDPGSASVIGYLAPGTSFDVATGAIVVDSPTVVVVTEPTRQAPYSADALTFSPGDTIQVLHYVGEGFFSASYRDSIIEVEAFWPWNEFASRPDDYTGRVLSEGDWSFWVRTEVGPATEAWVHVDDSAVSAPNALDPYPPVCR